MKILFISTFFINDLRTNVHGGYKRMSVFIDAIKEIASLDMLFYVPPALDITPTLVSKLERSFSKHWNVKINLFLCSKLCLENNKKKIKRWFHYGAGIFSFFRQSICIGTTGLQQLKAFESCLRRNPDAIFVFRLGSISPLLLTHETLPPVFFDLDDIEHIAFKRSIRQMPKWYSKILSYTQIPQLLLGELRAIRLAHKTFVCSEEDRYYLTNRWRQGGVATIPNAVKIPEDQPLTYEPTILFIGSYKHKPNIDAAEFLIEKIWPRVYQLMPSTNLIIAGGNPERIRGYGLSIPGLIFTGFVDDLDALYQKTKIICVPILAGGGTRLKIIEAAAYGKPIVSTGIGAEGLDLRDGRELLLRDDPESFIEAVLLLLKDHSLCERLGSAARARAVRLYDRNNILPLIQRHLKNDSKLKT